MPSGYISCRRSRSSYGVAAGAPPDCTPRGSHRSGSVRLTHPPAHGRRPQPAPKSRMHRVSDRFDAVHVSAASGGSTGRLSGGFPGARCGPMGSSGEHMNRSAAAAVGCQAACVGHMRRQGRCTSRDGVLSSYSGSMLRVCVDAGGGTCVCGSCASFAATTDLPHACGPTISPTDESAARNASEKIARRAPCMRAGVRPRFAQAVSSASRRRHREAVGVCVALQQRAMS